MFETNKIPHILAVAAASFALAACQANGGGAGAGGGGGGSNGTIAADDGIDANGDIEGDGSNTDTGFPNDPLGPGGDSVDGTIVQAGVDDNGDPVDTEIAYGDSGKRFLCLASINANAGAETAAAAGGLVGGVVGGLLDPLGGDSVNALTNSVKDQTLAIDSDLKTASVFTLTASALEIIGSAVGGAVDVIQQEISLPAPIGGFAVAALSFPNGTLDLSLQGSVVITTYLDLAGAPAEEPAEPAVSFPITSIDLLGQSVVNPGYAFVGRQVTKPYNRVT
ncbi:MAG: hypothetical protein ACSHXK_15010, partial [Oceanococcus sp.]